MMSVWLPTTSVSEPAIQGLPGAGEGRKKDYFEVKRARLNRDELKRSTTSSLLSPPASPLRILQWVAMMPTPTIILCLNTSILGTTSAYCQCRAAFVPFQVCVDYHPIKVPKHQFRCWQPGPSSCPTSCR